MNPEPDQWTEAEETFPGWIEDPDLYPVNPFTDFRKSIHIFFRNHLRKEVSQLFQLIEDLDFGQERAYKKSMSLDEHDHLNVYYSRSIELEPEVYKIIPPRKYTLDLVEIYTLYNESFQQVAALVTRNSGTLEDARDVFQDALVIMYDKMQWANPDLSACTRSTYICAISKNLWYEKLRAAKKERAFQEAAGKDSGEVSTLYYHEDPSCYDKVHAILTELGNPCKELIELFYFHNLSWEEIADKLGYSSAASARNQKYKCIERIRKQVLPGL